MLLRITAKTLRESSLKFKKRKLTRSSKLSSIYSLEQASDHTWFVFFENRQVVSLKHMMC